MQRQASPGKIVDADESALQIEQSATTITTAIESARGFKPTSFRGHGYVAYAEERLPVVKDFHTRRWVETLGRVA